MKRADGIRPLSVNPREGRGQSGDRDREKAPAHRWMAGAFADIRFYRYCVT